jgi:hypothetical protein
MLSIGGAVECPETFRGKAGCIPGEIPVPDRVSGVNFLIWVNDNSDPKRKVGQNKLSTMCRSGTECDRHSTSFVCYTQGQLHVVKVIAYPRL